MRQRIGFVYWSFIALLVVSVAQAAYWTIDQVWFVNAVVERAEEFDSERLETARELARQGLTADQIERAVPGVQRDGNDFAIDAGYAAALAEERRSRINRYLWEGAFFLLVLFGTLGAIAGVLRRDAKLRRRQQNFLATVSHEFKSPLASARIANETLAMRQLEPEQQKVQVERALRSLDRLDGMVDNLLDSARIESGALELQPTPMYVGDAIAAVVSGHAARADAQGARVTVDVDAELEVQADEFALTTVVSNLLDNALRATADAEAAAITIAARPCGREVVLTVTDNGAGFDAERAEDLFDKFYRPGDEMRRAGQGAGLGLYIVRGLMHLSGGEVTASSEGPGRGAVFTTTWPVPEDA